MSPVARVIGQQAAILLGLFVWPVTGLGAQMAAPGATGPGPHAMPVACADSMPLPADLLRASEYRSATPRTIVAPPLDPMPPRERVLAVRFFISARGTVDSVQVEGRADAAYRRALHDRMMEHTFWPAVFRDCAVPSRLSIEFTFP